MNISKRGNGYRVFESYKDSMGNYHKVSVTIKKNTPQERKKALAILQKKMETPSCNFRFSDLVTAYIQDQKQTCKMSTWKRNEATLERISKNFGNVYADKLTAGYCRSHLLKISENPATFNEYRRRLSSMIRWAYENDYINSTACIDKLKRLPDKSERQKVKDKFLQSDELKRVLELSSEYYRNVYEFLALSGLRIGELIALNDNDVTDVISVTKTYDYNNKIITTPKSPDSIRKVHIQPELADCIARIRRQSNLHRLLSGQRPSYFCVSYTGERLSYIALSREYRASTEEVTGRPLPIHSLRHTHASLMAEHGVNLEAISRRLGHYDSKITKEIYYHVTDNKEAKDAASFDAVKIL